VEDRRAASAATDAAAAAIDAAAALRAMAIERT